MSFCTAKAWGVNGVSIDVENLFNYVSNDQLLVAVKTCNEENGKALFRSSSGISVRLFRFANSLPSKPWCLLKESCLWKKGVCTRSRVAPVLWDIFIVSCYRAIENLLRENYRLKISRYVDDFPAWNRDCVENKEDNMVCWVLEVF